MIDDSQIKLEQVLNGMNQHQAIAPNGYMKGQGMHSVFFENIQVLESPTIHHLIQLDSDRRNVMGFFRLGSPRKLWAVSTSAGEAGAA
ncbi:MULTISPECIES: hypothetical protein [Aphanothece]|uniref:hypothetical protein n=1 Tax=Aphanothece TaxID=1121 RepID=UPI003984D049